MIYGISMNKDFLGQIDSEWRSHEWRSLASRFTIDQKNIIQCEPYVIKQ